jgi:hypothetical protein
MIPPDAGSILHATPHPLWDSAVEPVGHFYLGQFWLGLHIISVERENALQRIQGGTDGLVDEETHRHTKKNIEGAIENVSRHFR